MDGTVRIWSLKTGQNLHTLSGHSSLVGLLSLSPTTLVSAAADSTLRIWDPDTGTPLHTLQAHQGAITCFQHDEFKVLSGSDGALKMWDTRDGSVTRDLLTNIMGVWQVVFDERFCVAASNHQEHTFLDVWDFGEDGDADIEAANMVEEEDESEDEDERDGVIDEDEEDEDDFMADASQTPVNGTRRSDLPLGDRSSAHSNHWQAWNPTGNAPESGFPTGVPSTSTAFSHQSPWRTSHIHEAPSEEFSYGAVGTSSAQREVTPRPFRSDSKGKGRAVPPSVPGGLGLEEVPSSSSSSPFVFGSASVAAAESASTPPTSSSRPAAPPNIHSGWSPSAYTLATTQMGDDSPSKPRARRRER